MDQLTTIFAAPASDENGLNCVIKYSWQSNYLATICYKFFVNKHPALPWIQPGGYRVIFPIYHFLSCLQPRCCNTTGLKQDSTWLLGSLTVRIPKLECMRDGHCARAKACGVHEHCPVCTAQQSIQAISITGSLLLVVHKSTECTGHIDNWTSSLNKTV